MKDHWPERNIAVAALALATLVSVAVFVYLMIT